MKISLITTVFNESKNINAFLNSALNQILLPDEFVIVDGGSTDDTFKKIIDFSQKNKKLNIKIIKKKGNRSIGRNEAIKNTSNEIIAITDSGNILDKYWLNNLVDPFKDKSVDVVAGYYKGLAKNIFQKCLIPFVLVMPDKANGAKEFLPATRSMAIKKSVWKRVGGFDEKLWHNEDYAFANKLKENKAKIVFAKDAIVNWIPRQSVKQAFIMFFRFALGDAEAGIFRDKVIYIFLRYIYALYFFALSIIMNSSILWLTYGLLIILYLAWSVKKNYKYVNDSKAFIYLPLLQIVSDFAVLAGSFLGIIKNIFNSNFLKFIKNNKSILFILLAYILSMLSVISWGIPNYNHPFTYHMDEWHFSQALRTFVKYGTGSYSGAASIPLYHIISTYIFLIPFYLIHFFDPFKIKSSLDNLAMQTNFFEALRLHTLFYGACSISLIYLILKKFIKFKSIFLTILFTSSPIWIILSNYYKYDITLNFWIIATIYFLFKYINSQNFSNYIFSGIACGLALATKFTAFPLFLIYIFAYFIFSNKINLKYLATSILITVGIFLTVGIPDMLLLKGNYYELLNSTFVRGPKDTASYNLGYPTYIFLLFKEFPQVFGFFLAYLSYVSLLFWSVLLGKALIFKKIKNYKTEMFIFIAFILYLIPTISFGIDGGGNRALVLLPFMILLSAMFLKRIGEYKNNYRKFLYIILILGLIVQIAQSFAWQSIKLAQDPRIKASNWLLNNIKKGTVIGLENIPIYQQIPDLALKEFYEKERNKDQKTNFEYKVISSSDKALPTVLIITNDYNDVNYINNSPKKDLVRLIKTNRYRKIMTFYPYTNLIDTFSDPLVFILTFPSPRTISVYKANTN